MLDWARRLVGVVAIVVIAAAGMTAPLAHASTHAAVVPLAEIGHHSGNANMATVAATSCDEHGLQHGKVKAAHPCCAAACAAMLAFIVAPTDLSYPPSEREQSTLARPALAPSPIRSIERPPRTI